MVRPFADCRAWEVAPTQSAARTESVVAVDPAGHGDAVASAVAGRTHSAVADSSDAVAAAVAEASGWVVDATAAESSAWASDRDAVPVVAAAAAAAVPGTVADQCPDCHLEAPVETAAVHQPCCTVAVAVVAAGAVAQAAVLDQTCGPLPLVSRPCSAVLGSGRTGRGGPSSCWGRGSRGTGPASDVRSTHSDHPWAAFPLGPVVPYVVEAEGLRAFPAAAGGAAGRGERLRAGACRSRRLHCARASSRDAGGAPVVH